MLMDYEAGDVPGVNRCPPMFEEIPKAMELLQVGSDEIAAIAFNAYRKDLNGSYEFSGDTAVLVTLEGIGWDWSEETNRCMMGAFWADPDAFSELPPDGIVNQVE